jgi:hypothetical protein
MLGQPSSQRRQSFGPDAIHLPAAVRSGLNEPSHLEQFQMLDNARPRDGQLPGKLAGGRGNARQALKDHDAQRMSEQPEQPKYLPELDRV